MEAQHLQTALMSSLESIMKDLTVIILPIIDVLGAIFRWISFGLTVMNGLLKHIIVSLIAFKIASVVGLKVASVHANMQRKQHLLSSKETNITLGKLYMLQLRKAPGNMGIVGGHPIVLAISALAMLASFLIPMLLSSSEEENEINKDILSEQEKQTAALYDNEQSKILGSLAREMMQANMYNERLVIEAEQRNELAREANDIKHDAPEESKSFSNELTALPNSK